MNCRQIQPELSAYLDGEVAASVRQQIETHLTGCPNCRKRVEELRTINRGVAAIPQAQPAAQFLTQVRRKIAQTEKPAAGNWTDALFRPFWLKVPVEAVALLAVLALVMTLYRPLTRRESEVAKVQSPITGERKDVAAKTVVADEIALNAPKPPAENIAPKRELSFAERRQPVESQLQSAGKVKETPAAAPVQLAQESSAMGGNDLERATPFRSEPPETIMVAAVSEEAARARVQQLLPSVKGSFVSSADGRDADRAVRILVTLPRANVALLKQQLAAPAVAKSVAVDRARVIAPQSASRPAGLEVGAAVGALASTNELADKKADEEVDQNVVVEIRVVAPPD